MKSAQAILQAAIDAIGDRAPYRDTDSEKSFELAANLFTTLTDRDRFDDEDACLFLACVKMARAYRGQFHVDDFVDAAAYIALAGEARAGKVWPARKGPTLGEDVPTRGDDERGSEPDVAGTGSD